VSLNSDQRKHLASGLQAIAVGQLAYFGYRTVTRGEIGWFLVSLVVYAVIETLAVLLLRSGAE
jgi:hypothetical protein